MNETWHDRVKSVAQNKNMSIASVARAAGLGETKLRNALNVRTKKMYDDPLLENTAAALGVDSYWLLTGRSVGDYSPPAVVQNGVIIPVYDTFIGPDIENLRESNSKTGELVLCYDLLPSNHNDLICLSIMSDSMAPTLNPGQKVVVDLSCRNPAPSGIYVITDGFVAMARRIDYDLANQEVRIISDNPSYSLITIAVNQMAASTIKIVGRVVAAIQRL